MAIFEFGRAKQRSECFKHIDRAAALVSEELKTVVALHQIADKVPDEEGPQQRHEAMFRQALGRAVTYLAIIEENVMVALGRQRSIFATKPAVPLDPDMEGIELFFRSVSSHLAWPPMADRKNKAAPPADAPDHLAIDGGGRLHLLHRLPLDADNLECSNDWHFIPASGPIDADQREWLAQAIWGIDCSIDDADIPDDETLLHHARERVVRSR